jgi:3-methylcrotonyl-CoA carboxylase alpha subunit
VGEPLATIAPVVLRGHAFEARINAEDASDGFSPQIGTITHLRVPDGVRWDSAVEVGSDIGPLYDSMIAKLIVHGPDRATALDRLRTALDQLIVGGPVSTGGFHRWLVDQPAVVDGRVTTRFLHDVELPARADAAPAASAAARAWCRSRDEARRGGPWSALAGFRTTPHRRPREVALLDGRGEVHDLTVDTARAEAEPLDSEPRPTSVDLDGRSVAVNDAGQTHTFRVLGRSERWAPAAGRGHGHPTAVVAPFPAMVVEVLVGPDDSVAAGETVVVIEAMKMLHTLAAAGPGLIDEVRVAVGDQVATAQILVTFHTGDASSAAAHTGDTSGGGP